MLSQPTIDKLHEMRLEPMIQAWETLDRDEAARALSFEEKLGLLLVDRLYAWRRHVLWRTRRAGMAIRCCTHGRLPYFATWHWLVPMAVCETCWCV